MIIHTSVLTSADRASLTVITEEDDELKAQTQTGAKVKKAIAQDKEVPVKAAKDLSYRL